MKRGGKSRRKLKNTYFLLIIILVVVVLVFIFNNFNNKTKKLPNTQYQDSDRLYCEKDSDCTCHCSNLFGLKDNSWKDIKCFLDSCKEKEKIYYIKCIDKLCSFIGKEIFNLSFKMGSGDEEGPPNNFESQKIRCEYFFQEYIKVNIKVKLPENLFFYKDINFEYYNCNFKNASKIEEDIKSGNFVSTWKWICYFECSKSR